MTEFEFEKLRKTICNVDLRKKQWILKDENGYETLSRTQITEIITGEDLITLLKDQVGRIQEGKERGMPGTYSVGFLEEVVEAIHG